jgi:protein-S-isoprenylcysteine O-methyltransferase Ste14
MQPWPLRIGKFLFRFRSFTPLPLILLTFILFKPLSTAPLWTVAGLTLAFLGEGIRIHSIGNAGSGTSGRENFLKAESLNTTGLYSLVRNPLYWGNLFIFAGLLTVYAQPLALIIVIVFLFLQYHFIMLAEETFLQERYGQAYADYCSRVRRWLPRLAGYATPQRPFAFKKVVFKENDSCFNLLVAAVLILAYKEKVFSGQVRHSLFFVGAGLLLTVLYAGLKVIKKKHPVFSDLRDF